MQDFINRPAVSLASHLKMGLYNIFPFPAEELRQGSFIPSSPAKRSAPAGASPDGYWDVLGQSHQGLATNLHQAGHLFYEYSDSRAQHALLPCPTQRGRGFLLLKMRARKNRPWDAAAHLLP